MASEFLAAEAVVLLRLVLRWLGSRHAEKFAATRELLCAMAIAEEPVIADAMKALGQDVQQEAADELIGGEGHDFLPIVVAIVLPSEADPAVLDVAQAVVGNGDAVRIASDVFEDLLGSGKGRLGKDDPRGSPQRSKVAPEGGRLPQGLQGREEAQLPGIEGLLQIFQETGDERDGTAPGREGRILAGRRPSGPRPEKGRRR